jgi:cyclin T
MATAGATMSGNRKHFDISQLPSLKDGMTVKEESDKRRKTCRFIEEAGRVLKLPRVAVATAMVFFHRFYAKHSFSTHDRFEVAVACLVLAAKTEESPKKLNTVIDECYKLKLRGMQAGRISQPAGAAAASPATTTGNLDPKGEEFLKLKERILLLERVILHTIGFELSIDHPYKFMVEQIKKMVQKRQLEYIKPVDGPTAQIYGKMMNEMVQYAMNFANDSMHTSLCLQFEPHKIATACVYLAGHFAKVRPVNKQTWLDVLGPSDIESLASISMQVVELITERKGVNEDTFEAIRQDLDALNKSGVASKSEEPKAEGPDAKRQRRE